MVETLSSVRGVSPVADSVCWHQIAPQLGELTNVTGAIADKPDIPYYYVH
jgi:hypothetical protein